MGYIYHREFKEYGKAVSAYNDLLRGYPESKYHSRALRAVKVLGKKWRSVENKQRYYDKKMEKLGKLVRDPVEDLELKRYVKPDRDNIINLYDDARHLENRKDSPGVEIDGKLKEECWREAIEKYDKIVATYPESDKADDALYRSAYIYNKKFRDYGKAERVYNYLVTNYPRSEYYSRSVRIGKEMKKKVERAANKDAGGKDHRPILSFKRYEEKAAKKKEQRAASDVESGVEKKKHRPILSFKRSKEKSNKEPDKEISRLLAKAEKLFQEEKYSEATKVWYQISAEVKTPSGEK